MRADEHKNIMSMRGSGNISSFSHRVSSHTKSFSPDRFALYINIISYSLYQMQGALFTSGGFFSQVLLLLVIAINLIYFAKSLLFQKQSVFFYLWTSFFLLNVVGFILWNGALSNPHHFSMLKGIVLCLASFYPTYYMARKGTLRGNDLIVFFSLQLISSIFSFFYSATQEIAMYSIDEEKVVNNVSYNFVFLIPFLFLLNKHQSLSFLILFVIVFFILQGAKRGAIVVGSVLVLIYLYQVATKAGKQKGAYKNIIFVLLGIIAMGYAVNQFISSNVFLVARFEALMEGDSSGRDSIYATIWNSWWNGTYDWSHFLFGFGFAGSLSLTGGLFAHNDWLEALSNFGLVGVTLYLVLILKGFSYIIQKRWGSRDDRMLLLCIMTAWLLTSLFSMWYTSLNVLTQSLLLGYLMGKNNCSTTLRL